MTDQTPRTAAATRKASRNADERKAEHLRGRGWTCIPPELIKLTENQSDDGTGHRLVRMEFVAASDAAGGCE